MADKTFLEIFGYNSDGTKIKFPTKQSISDCIAISAISKMDNWVWDAFCGDIDYAYTFKRHLTEKEMQWLYENQPMSNDDIEFINRWRR